MSELDQLTKLQKDNKELETSKNQAYYERNQLVAALSKIYPSWLGRHDPTDKEWDREWLNIVFIEVTTKRYEQKMVQGGFEVTGGQQMSWHIHDNDLQYFSHLQYDNKKKWDGHTTEQKYNRLQNIVKPKRFFGLF